MKLLILNVDRDDDLGRKTGIQGPCIGREAVLRAATALAVADPEEADANAMFAAIKEFDEISADPKSYGADAVFVAAATGHLREGTHADAAMARQVDQILAETQADHAILVSDGGEDEHIIPILATRLKVDGVQRVVIKQAKSLEGIFYLFHRLMNDEKLQRKFFLPLAFLLIAAGLAFGLNRWDVLVMTGLFLAAFYIFVQVFQWQAPLGSFFERVSKQLHAGKLSFVASLIAFLVVAWGGYQAVTTVKGLETGTPLAIGLYSLYFLQFIYWYFVGAILIILSGRLLDDYLREHRAHPGYLKSIAFVLAAAVALVPLIEGAVKYWAADQPLEELLTADLFTKLFFGGFLLMVGLIAHRYLRPAPPRPAPVGAN